MVVCGLATPTAQADGWEPPPNEQLVTSPRLLAMHDTAKHFWDVRGWAERCPAPLLLADLGQYGAGLAFGPAEDGTCPTAGLWLDTATVASDFGEAGRRSATLSYRRFRLGLLCVTVTHEEGHTRGVEHSTDPASFMYVSVSRIEQITGDCRRLARHMLPRGARAKGRLTAGMEISL
jgi:hypothetical protein